VAPLPSSKCEAVRASTGPGCRIGLSAFSPNGEWIATSEVPVNDPAGRTFELRLMSSHGQKAFAKAVAPPTVKPRWSALPPFLQVGSDGTVWVGGLDVQGNGVFGSGALPTANERRFQAPVTGLADALAFDLGWYHGCAARAGGSVVCWGKGQSGELGDGSKMNRNELVVATGVAGAVGVAVGDGTSCALLGNGEVMCWGVGHPGGKPSPTLVAGLVNARDVRGGFGHFCALHDDGTVSCWGRNGAGQVGPVLLGAAVAQPTRVEGITDAVAIGLGAEHSCALLKEGNIVCWGSNQFGQLGTGTFTSPLVLTPVKGL
jgi:alpha-tubulin suppressor-like RCC1 family protein